MLLLSPETRQNDFYFRMKALFSEVSRVCVRLSKQLLAPENVARVNNYKVTVSRPHVCRRPPTSLYVVYLPVADHGGG